MKKLLALIILTLTFSGFSQNQTKMNIGAKDEYKEADIELNNVYQKILTEYKSDPIFIDRLKKAQRSWITYRDAQLEMKFPAEDKQLQYGSSYPACASQYLKELTEERTEKLKFWLNGIDEGDLCSGSVKIK